MATNLKVLTDIAWASLVISGVHAKILESNGYTPATELEEKLCNACTPLYLSRFGRQYHAKQHRVDVVSAQKFVHDLDMWRRFLLPYTETLPRVQDTVQRSCPLVPLTQIFGPFKGSLLDLGCGDGRNTPKADQVFSVDLFPADGQPANFLTIELGRYQHVLLTNVLHCLDDAAVKLLLGKLFPALVPGGRVCVFESRPSAGYDLHWHLRYGGRARSDSELTQLGKLAGFAVKQVENGSGIALELTHRA